MCSDATLNASLQLALVGHDVGHNQLFATRAGNSIMGIFVTLFLGAGVQWWKYNHNTHHVTPNSSDHDPDIQVRPLLFQNHCWPARSLFYL